MSPASGGRSRASATPILPENLIRRKLSLRGVGVVLPEADRSRRVLGTETYARRPVHETAETARSSRALDEIALKLWRALAEGFIADADAEAVSEAVEARRVAFAGDV